MKYPLLPCMQATMPLEWFHLDNEMEQVRVLSHHHVPQAHRRKSVAVANERVRVCR